jgi:hypothetical protein
MGIVNAATEIAPKRRNTRPTRVFNICIDALSAGVPEDKIIKLFVP